MSTQLQSVLDAALRLPEAERGELATRLMDTLNHASVEADESGWTEELLRRIDDVRSGRETTVPWDAVRQKMADMNNATG